MEKAKAAVSDFMAKAGKHDTTVHENVAPAVTHETVKPHRHEKVTTAVDKEIHQDHYHTSVQPVKDREVLPEQHHHNLESVQHRQFEHGNDHDVQERLKREAAQFSNSTETATARETHSAAPQVVGEHVHHHVHETIQPVVQKETIEPHVVHTTVPIHEVHHQAAQHHSTSALPAVSMADFKKQGGVLGGREERYDGFEGEPRNTGGALKGQHSITGDHGSGTHSHHHDGTHFDRPSDGSITGHGSGLAGTGRTDTSVGRDTGLPGTKGSGTAAGIAGTTTVATGVAGASATHKMGQHGSDAHTDNESSSTSTTKKPSMLQKLNSLADADGDGKKGFMD
ncbi:hypothetical protein B0J12DRAFT_456269 [Macrophomina phaseolina]|uniref:Allergen n=1 Tax=Macrophomina phaseolina TaxID=35725 RepID=A0ABQ8GII2_9PEZI|nr:hypothetical protein B0J12DRAFT_456269 [Macrophomina phaseolina]